MTIQPFTPPNFDDNSSVYFDIYQHQFHAKLSSHMAFTEFNKAMVEVKMDNFMESFRPPEKIRSQLDYGYTIENQSITIIEKRPHFETGKITSMDIAKTTYIKSRGIWKLYWMRADMKWHMYEPVPNVEQLEDWLQVVKEDQHCCFFG